MIYKHNGSIITDIGGKWLTCGSSPVDPYNPLNLPSNTVRVRTSDGNVPRKTEESSYSATYETATLVSGTSDVYDVYKSGTDFSKMFSEASNVVEVLGANTTGITNMGYMFNNCVSLTNIPLFNTIEATNMSNMFAYCNSLSYVPLFDTSNVTTMYYMFYGCSSLITVPLFDTHNVTNMNYTFDRCTALTTIPLFDTSKVTNIGSMFYGCTSVQSGALALYQQASSQTNPPTIHSLTFRNCGSNTVTGAAELAQIPSSWGGTGA